MRDEYIEHLIGLLSEKGREPMPLVIVEKRLTQMFDTLEESPKVSAKEAIEYSLEHWIVEKVVAYPESEYNLPSYRRVWCLKIPSKEERMRLKNLSSVQQAFLKMLYESEGNGRLGSIKEEDALKELQDADYEVDKVPWISDMLDISYVPTDDGYEIWYYLVPEDEKTEEYKKKLEEMSRRAWEKELRFMRLDSENDE
ncbi:hypothetical protein EU537_11800 [Candidatus Thorarchaeota archaeon]|nr:MAG: hypothetical protein EU537_11800 [Candidatus Thorarchaeota archaeon]